MRQNPSQNGRKVIAGVERVAKLSATPRNLIAVILEHNIFAR